MIEDVERGHQLAAEEAGAAALPGERRQRLDHMEVAHAGAEARFEAPDAEDDTWIDTKTVLHAAEQRAVLLIGDPAIGDALIGDQQRPVLRPGHGELGLVTVAIQHLLVRLQAGEGAIQRSGRDAGAARISAQASEKALKAARRGSGRGQSGSQQQATTQHAALCATAMRAEAIKLAHGLYEARFGAGSTQGLTTGTFAR
jgi:hypothetical protein